MILACVACGAFPIQAAEREIVIALDLQTPGMDVSQSEQVVKLFREELEKTGRFTLVDRYETNNEVAKLGYRPADGCDSARCYGPLSQAIGVYKIVSARMERQGNAFVLSAQWITTGQSTAARPIAVRQPYDGLSAVLSSGLARLAAQIVAAASGGGQGSASAASDAIPAAGATGAAKPWLDKAFALRQPNGEFQPADLAAYQLSKAISAEPTNATAYATRGQVYLQLEQYEDALSDYTEAIRLEPRRASHYIGRALVRETLRQSAPMCADLRKACELGDQGGCGMAKKQRC